MSGNEPLKPQLSRALALASTAVLQDNAQNFEGALAAYEESCKLLQDVIRRSAAAEDRRKLELIRKTYTTRIEELQQHLEITEAVTITSSRDDWPFSGTEPSPPLTGTSVGSAKTQSMDQYISSLKEANLHARQHAEGGRDDNRTPNDNRTPKLEAPRPLTSKFIPVIEDRYAGHNTYANRAEVPYKHLEVLGRGNYGLVDKVERTLPLSDWDTPGIYARKVIRTGYSRAARQQERIMSEINIVRKLRHSHVVELVETYQAGLEFGIIMSPAAEMDLKEFLAHAHEDEAIVHRTDSCLLSWIDCIVSAVSYIHYQRVRHKDLKPANILVRGKGIFITDFGISKDLIGETTGSVGDPSERSPMYCAPESNVEGERRGRSADMFSLGCIILEMLTVLMGESLGNFEDYRITDHSRAYAANHKKNYLWMIELKNKYHIKNPKTYPYMSHSARISTKLAIVAALLDLDPDDRPRASELDGYNGAGACDGIASCFPYQDRDGLVSFESLKWPYSASLEDDELPQTVRDKRWLDRRYLTQRHVVLKHVDLDPPVTIKEFSPEEWLENYKHLDPS